MTIAYITEFVRQARDHASLVMPVSEYPPIAKQTVAIGAISAASAELNAKTTIVRLKMRAAGHVAFGTAKGPATQVWQVDDTPAGNAFVDETTDFNSPATGDVLPFPAAEAINDYFAIGAAAPYGNLRFVISTAGVGGVVAWEYWNGAWTALSVTDGTTGFTAAAGTYDVAFTAPSDWTVLSIGGEGTNRYYIRARVTTVFSTNPVLTQGWINGAVATIADAHYNLGDTEFPGVLKNSGLEIAVIQE